MSGAVPTRLSPTPLGAIRGRRRLAVPAALALAALASCGWRYREARARYDEGVAAIAAKKWEDASRLLIEARDGAGGDDELRFRAAYNLGVAHAGLAESQGDQPEKAIASLGQAVAWFRSALSGRPDDADARHDLQVSIRRLALLEDRARAGQNALEGRLGALIRAARDLRDAVRGVMEKQRARGAAADPLAFQGDLDGLAAQARVLLADAGAVSDLASDEMGRIDARKAGERPREEKVRAVQLRNLDRWVQRARAALSDLARSLARLDATLGHERAEEGLDALKRAEEQLRDPVAILRAIVGDELTLSADTRALAAARRAGRELDGAAPAKAPVWLTPAHLGEAQARARDRLGETAARLQAAVDAPEETKAAAGAPGAGTGDADADVGRRARALAMAREALPHLHQSSMAMDAAGEALVADRPDEAVGSEERAVEELASAIERFADLRGLVDLAWAEQGQVVSLLTPPAPSSRGAAAAPAMTAEERARAVTAATGRNRERVGRMAGLIAEEKAALARSAESADRPPAPGGHAGAAPADPAAAQKARAQREARRALFDRAEALRGRAAAALARVASQAARGAALSPARDALARLTELRDLLLSVVERMEELVREQAETRDRTATAQASSGEERGAALPPLARRQNEHAAMGEALSRALASQADDASARTSGPEAADAAKRLREAAGEVQAGAGEMAGAADALGKARDQAATMSVDLTPTLDNQQKALGHLEEALRLLKPPRERGGKQARQEPDQGQPQKRGGQEKEKQGERKRDEARQDLRRAAQAVRDREAMQRRRERERQRLQDEPVEKDW
jgi:hypothetical protein